MDLPSVFPGKITVEETRFKAAVSEATAQKIGMAINAIISNMNLKLSVFNTAGAFTWTCPVGVYFVIIEGCGGGGGAAGGDTPGLSAGYGGQGCKLQYRIVPTVPGIVYNITVGAGGNIIVQGGGGPGGASSFDTLVAFNGGGGGGYGTVTAGAIDFTGNGGSTASYSGGAGAYGGGASSYANGGAGTNWADATGNGAGGGGGFGYNYTGRGYGGPGMIKVIYFAAT